MEVYTCLASLLLLFLLVACGQNTVETAVSTPAELTIIADGDSQTINSNADTVRAVLEEVAIPLAAAAVPLPKSRASSAPANLSKSVHFPPPNTPIQRCPST